MTRRKEFPFSAWLYLCSKHEAVFEFSCLRIDQLDEWTDGDDKFKSELIKCNGCRRMYFVDKKHVEMFVELVRRVLDKDDFMEFGKKCQREIFQR